MDQGLAKKIRIPIIPPVPGYYELPGPKDLDYKALACFTAIGFFLGEDTHFTNVKALQPGHEYTFSDDGNVSSRIPYFKWFYEPRSVSFGEAVEEFGSLLERLVKTSCLNRKVILPLSGGLDSRTLAAALHGHSDVFAYSYSFPNGVDENSFGQAIAKNNNFPFSGFVIPPGYLWESIERIAAINGCYADFTNPRQMAVLESLKGKGDVFLLGHWGDVLFDDMGVASDIQFEVQKEILKKKILKKRGRDVAEALWQAWGLSGTFEEYFDEKIMTLLDEIPIQDANARIRAFKSLHWASRWTSSNLTLFKSIHDIELPYYEEAMCRFICTIPEKYLAARRIQIDYLKTKAPGLASIPWQKYDPCNLYNYVDYNSLKYLPYRAARKIKNRLLKFSGKRMVTSNWEIQFLGSENDTKLKSWLLENRAFSELVPKGLVADFYGKFQVDPREYHHTMNMLLTVSLFASKTKKLHSWALG